MLWHATRYHLVNVFLLSFKHTNSASHYHSSHGIIDRDRSTTLVSAFTTWSPVQAGIPDLSQDFQYFDRGSAGLPHATGGYSDVYQVRWERPFGGLQVAIKILRPRNISNTSPSADNDQEVISRSMLREMRAWKSAEHARIVPLLGYAILNAGPCFISPWYTNGNIIEYLQSNPDANRRALLLQVAEGLEFLHNSTPVIVHTDLKGTNVLIGDDGDAMLSDFGLSKIIDDVPSGLTSSNMAGGTLRWMAPEVLLNGKKPDVLADIYSFGLLALEIMTGRIPFHKYGSDVTVTQAKIRKEKILPADYPELGEKDPIWPLLRKCTKRNPTSRPTASKVVKELRNRDSKAFQLQPGVRL
ncbi:hypothetical protein FRB99_004598 [Tulasnella sp. 403]|nr:hypothetical protein FRB99_004598 [Tulasnella sp. 403]